MSRFRYDDLAWLLLTLGFTLIGVMLGISLGALWWL